MLGLPYQIGKVTLAVAKAIFLPKPSERVRQRYQAGQLFAFGEGHTNKDDHNTETKHVNEPDMASYSLLQDRRASMPFL